SLHDVELSLLAAIVLVVLVVFFFLRDVRATLIPSVAVPLSLVGTFGVMYVLGYSLDNLSLMALTVATGFVVDDAIVVLENISRHMEEGMDKRSAALLGAQEVGFTVLSMSTSLVAVFIPLLLMGGIVGRLFREFAITLSVAVMVSLVVSLVTTPVMCAFILQEPRKPGRLVQLIERAESALVDAYSRSLKVALRHGLITALVLAAVVGLNGYLYWTIPKGFFPQQDTGRLSGGIQADQSISFQLMRQKLVQLIDIVRKDQAVENVAGFTGGGASNGGNVFVTLKPLSQRKETADQVIARLRKETASVAGARLFFQSVQDIRVGGRAAQAQYQYTLQSDDVAELQTWTPKILAALTANKSLTDVNVDQQNKGLETDLIVDRTMASRLGLSQSSIDNTLYDAFGQRQVSTIYNPLNQYHVIMELAPRFWQSPDALNDLYVSTSGGAVSGSAATGGTISEAVRNAQASSIGNASKGGKNTGSAVSTHAETMIPLKAFSHFEQANTPLSVNHQGLFASSTISFNLPEGKSLSDAQAIINQTVVEIGVPPTIHGTFQGTAGAFQASLDSEPILILAALLAIYLVLGVLYESYMHPLTILSTLPSAGVGAVGALMLTGTEFSIIALVGVILLIGIVKKNAIMIIDFALDAERSGKMGPRDAIFHACMLRFRPIMMTTLAAMLGAMPLAFGYGDGAELRRPLGISIFGGLIVSQALTLYTTPVVYLYLDRLRRFLTGSKASAP
ncbi:MAG TPA: efflux RND transporter permease subunit, partial [Myxococcota bacterium]